jgi:hypothetical protein
MSAAARLAPGVCLLKHRVGSTRNETVGRGANIMEKK